MTFWQIFWPVFSALFAITVITELFQAGIGYYLHRKERLAREDWEAKVASGEVNPMQMMMANMGGMGPSPMGIAEDPTTSGSGGNGVNHGQYL